jgi:hypothetical protein
LCTQCATCSLSEERRDDVVLVDLFDVTGVRGAVDASASAWACVFAMDAGNGVVEVAVVVVGGVFEEMVVGGEVGEVGKVGKVGEVGEVGEGG